MAQGWVAPWYSEVRPRPRGSAPKYGNRARGMAQAHAKRAKERGVEALSPIDDVEAWVGLQQPCAYCGDPKTGIDHVLPISKGGKHEISNFQPLCRRCNMIKLDLSEEELMAHLRKILPALESKCC